MWTDEEIKEGRVKDKKIKKKYLFSSEKRKRDSFGK